LRAFADFSGRSVSKTAIDLEIGKKMGYIWKAGDEAMPHSSQPLLRLEDASSAPVFGMISAGSESGRRHSMIRAGRYRAGDYRGRDQGREFLRNRRNNHQLAA
jgi:hypothetical protein